MKGRCVQAITLGMALLVSGCASSGKPAGTASTSPAAGVQDAAAGPMGELRLAEFILGVGDEISIEVYRHDNLSQEMTIGPSGKIMFPLVGDIQAAGKDVFAVRDEIAQKLSRYLVKPEVTVQLSEVKSRRTLVLGEVNSPGSFVLDTEQTALDALSKAGGATSDANLSRVLLVRNAGGTKKDEIYLDLKQAFTGKDYSANVALQNGDILYVPTKSLANIGRYASYLSSIIGPIVSLEGGIVLWPLVKESIKGKPSPQVSIPTSQ